MKRMAWTWVATALVAGIAWSGCGYLKKKEFLPEYEAYKAETEARLSSQEAAIQTNTGRIDALEQADEGIKESIQAAKEEAMSAAEQGAADTLSAAKSYADEQDAALRDQLTAAINEAKTEAIQTARNEDQKLRSEVMSAIDELKTEGMRSLAEISSRSESSLSQIRRELNEALVKAIPQKLTAVYFATARASLTDEAKAELDKIIGTIQEHPDAIVRVIGHADARPILSGRYVTNLQLSEARAQAVADYLKSKGVQNKIEVAGRGHFQTVGSQASEEGLAQSRRAEVYLVFE